jgi:hypothetical protein
VHHYVSDRVRGIRHPGGGVCEPAEVQHTAARSCFSGCSLGPPKPPIRHHRRSSGIGCDQRGLRSGACGRPQGEGLSNATLNLPAGVHHPMAIKTKALAHFLFTRRSQNGSSVLQVIHHVLYGGSDADLPLRLWEATTDGPWRIEHLGISALGVASGRRGTASGARKPIQWRASTNCSGFSQGTPTPKWGPSIRKPYRFS